jgi:type II secretory pathway component PulM
MKRILIPVALLLFSAGVYFLFVLPNQIEQKFKDAVPENVEVNYKDFQVNLLDKSAVVETLKLEDDKVRVEMGRAEVKTEEYSGEMIQVQLNEVTLTDKENEEIYKAQQVTIQEIDRKQLEATSKNATLRDLSDTLKRDAIRQVEMNEVSVTKNGQTTTVDSVKVETLGEGKVFGVQAEGVRSKDGESEIAIASVNVDEVEVDSEDQLTLNQLKLGGIQVKEGEGDLTIGDVSIDQVRNQQANNFSMKQLNLQNFENIEKLSIESAEARNIPLVTLLENEIDLLQRLLGGTFEGLQIRNLFVQPENEEAKQVREIDLEQLDFGTTENGHRYVRNLKLNILGIVINLSDFPEDFAEQARNFTESDEIGMNLFLEITGSHEQQDYELGIGVGLEKMADLHLEGHFSNVPIEIFEFEKYDDSELESILSEKWTKIGVVKLLARYDERGFLEYSMGKFSTESGFSKAAIARQVSQQFENTAARYNLSGSEEMASELEKFVLEPKTLRIGFLPEDPLNFEEIAMLALLNPGQLQQKSNFSLQSAPE